MENGLAIIEKTDTQTMGFYIDQDVLEFAKLNAKAKKHIANAEDAKRKADQARRKAEKAEAQRKAYTLNSIGYILTRCGIAWAVTWAGTAGMISPVICVPVSLFCLCTACVRLGAWFGRGGRNVSVR